MIHPHLNDRQLQRYLNKTCSELEYRKSGKHIQACASCRMRLHTYLEMESLLDRTPLLAMPPALEERIMRAVYDSAEASDEAPPPLQVEEPRPVSIANRWRAELTHGLIAVAATYLFIYSGIFGKIMSNADSWGAGVQTQVAVIESVVARISLQLLS
jgi:hypothetical protein